MNGPKFIVLCGDGINCEYETLRAIENSGGSGEIVHINSLLEHPDQLLNYAGLAIPGGFSFGDELGSGRILALKIKTKLGSQFKSFVESGRPIIGICNGLQVLMNLGVFETGERTLALAPNRDGHFRDQWVEMEICSQNGPWLKGLQGRAIFPMRHGEGRVVSDREEGRSLEKLYQRAQVAFRYVEDVNGSMGRIAGLVNERGNVLGLMPHPEAAMEGINIPSGLDHGQKILGKHLFENLFKNLRSIS